MMIEEKWRQYLDSSLKALLESPPLAFKNMVPSKLPQVRGVYLITVRSEPYYVGRTTNIRSRIYSDHLMGSFVNARLKKYLVEEGECPNIQEAKELLRQFAHLQWIEVEDMRTRGALEGYFTGVLFPKYGIYKEH